MMSMALSGVVMAVFTTGMIQVYRSVGAAENAGVSQTQVSLAFETVDREIRYASGITEPNTAAVGGAWYVEFLGVTPDGGPVCHQLRLDGSGVLQQLTWAPGSPPAAGARGRTLASNLVVTAPFERLTPDQQPADYQRLRLRLTARSGAATSASDVTFTALNTSRDTTDPNVCIEGRPAA
jgi:hypothetical protein